MGGARRDTSLWHELVAAQVESGRLGSPNAYGRRRQVSPPCGDDPGRVGQQPWAGGQGHACRPCAGGQGRDVRLSWGAPGHASRPCSAGQARGASGLRLLLELRGRCPGPARGRGR
jgi:hypothetical protein